MKITKHWFVERLQKMSDERKKDLHATVRFFSELQELVYEDDYDSMHDIGDAVDEIDSGIAEAIDLYVKRSLELSEIDLWEPCEPMNEEEQAAVDDCDQMQRGEFI